MAANAKAKDAIESCVAAAQRRLLAQTALREAFVALSIALVGPLLLLTLGARWLPAAILWVFLVAGVLTAVWRLSRAAVPGYRAAQIVDARLGSEDEIATAYYFREFDDASSVAPLQRAFAARRAAAGDLIRTLPWRMPPSAAPTAAALLLCLGLLVMRISFQPQLDFEPPLYALALATAEETEDGSANTPANEKPEAENRAGKERREGEPPTPLGEEALHRRDATPPETAQAPGDPFEDLEVEGLSVDSNEFGDQLPFDSEDGQQTANRPTDEDPGSGEAAEGAPESDQQSGDWSEESRNLLDRLQDAFRNMVESLTQDQPQRAGSSQQEAQGEGQDGEPASDPGEQARADGSGGQPSDAEMEGGPSEQGAPQQAADGQGDSDSQEAGAEGASAGASGSAEGSKELSAQAAQQAAMDALEEFYLQRSEQLSGEITVATSIAEQTAHTPFQPTANQHADSGGAIARDEVPPAYQSYIENYFRNLRGKDRN